MTIAITTDAKTGCPVAFHMRQVSKLRRAVELAKEEESKLVGEQASSMIDQYGHHELWTEQLSPLITAHETMAMQQTAKSLEGAIFQVMLSTTIGPVGDISWKDSWNDHRFEKREAEEREALLELVLERAVVGLLNLSDDYDLAYLSGHYRADGMLKSEALENLLEGVEQLFQQGAAA